MTSFDIEANFDFEYAMALTGQTVINIQVGDEYQQGTINNMLTAFDAYYCGALDSSLTQPILQIQSLGATITQLTAASCNHRVSSPSHGHTLRLASPQSTCSLSALSFLNWVLCALL